MLRSAIKMLLMFCISIWLSHTASAEITIPSDFSVRISRSGCEGFCPIYTVSLDAQGNVTWNGEKFVRKIGVATKKIELSEVQAIAEKIRVNGIFSFSSTSRQCIDTPSVEVMLTNNGHNMSTTHDSCSQQKTHEGQEIARFANYVESVIAMECWIKDKSACGPN